MIAADRGLLKRLYMINGLMGEVVIKMLADGNGELQPQDLLELAKALDPIARELLGLVEALRERAADLGVLEGEASTLPEVEQ